jgi:flagellar hook-associated protein 3 FlgL
MSSDAVLGNDLMIEARNGEQLWIDLAGAETVQDVLDRINSHPGNTPAIVTARLAQVGNGIELVDSSGGAGTLTVHTVEGSEAARYLGFVAEDATSSNPADVMLDGANQVLTSEDRHTLETDSVFNTLLRLRAALVDRNAPEIGAAFDRLDADLNRINLARAEMGTRLQNLEVVGVRLEDENVQLKSALSDDLDVDLVEAISNLTARQFAFEASLRTAGSMLQISLLDYL